MKEINSQEDIDMLPRVFNDRFFDDFMDFPFDRAFDALKPARRIEGGLMKTDVKKTDTGYEFMVDLPGFKKEDIDIKLDDGYLTVSAEKKSEVNEGGDEDKQQYRRKMRANSFHVNPDTPQLKIISAVVTFQV